MILSAVVSLLVEFQERLDIEVSISDFDRDEWATPNMVIKKVGRNPMNKAKFGPMLFSIGPFCCILTYSNALPTSTFK